MPGLSGALQALDFRRDFKQERVGEMPDVLKPPLGVVSLTRGDSGLPRGSPGLPDRGDDSPQQGQSDQSGSRDADLVAPHKFFGAVTGRILAGDHGQAFDVPTNVFGKLPHG